MHLTSGLRSGIRCPPHSGCCTLFRVLPTISCHISTIKIYPHLHRRITASPRANWKTSHHFRRGRASQEERLDWHFGVVEDLVQGAGTLGKRKLCRSSPTGEYSTVPVSAMQMPRRLRCEIFEFSIRALRARVMYLVQPPRISKEVADRASRHFVPLHEMPRPLFHPPTPTEAPKTRHINVRKQLPVRE